MNTYVPLRGPDVKFIVRDRKGKKLAVAKGNSRPYPNDYIVVINGITEVLALAPCAGHECYVQDGHVVALFYVVMSAGVKIGHRTPRERCFAAE